MKYLNIILFAAVLLISTEALLYTDKSRKAKKLRPAEISDRLELSLLAAALVIGLAMRLWQFGSVPEGFNQDGAMAAVDANALAMYGTDRFGTHLPAHLYAWGFGQMSSLLSYLMVPFIKLMGLNPVSARLPQLLVSIMGAVFFWLFTRDSFGKRDGIIAAFFVAVNPWHFVQSRWALDCNLLPHFFVAGVCLLNRGSRGNKAALYTSMLFFGLCMYCYGITIYTLPVFLVLACVLLLRKKLIRPLDAVICAGAYLAVSWAFILTMAINFFGWETIELPFVTLQNFPDSVRSGDILLFSDKPFRQLVENFSSLMGVSVLQKRDLPWNEVRSFGTMYLFSTPFALCGIASAIRRRKDTGTQLLLLMLLTGVWAGLMTNNVNINRANLIYYPVMLLIVLGIDYVVGKFRFMMIPTGCVYALCAVLLCGSYFGSYRQSLSSAFFSGFGDALTAAEETGAEIIYITADTQYNGSRNVSEILTLFYDRTDAEYYQGKTMINHGSIELPYEERFVYLSFDETNIPDEKNAVCVICRKDKPLFDGEYRLYDYGHYALAVKEE